MIKLSFLFDREAFINKEYGFNSTFFRYGQGAYSEKLGIMRDRLLFSHFLTNKDVYASLTEEGYNFIDKINAMVLFDKTGENQLINEIAQKHGRHSGRDLMEMHYLLEIKGKQEETKALK